MDEPWFPVSILLPTRHQGSGGLTRRWTRAGSPKKSSGLCGGNKCCHSCTMNCTTNCIGYGVCKFLLSWLLSTFHTLDEYHGYYSFLCVSWIHLGQIASQENADSRWVLFNRTDRATVRIPPRSMEFLGHFPRRSCKDLDLTPRPEVPPCVMHR